MVIYISQKKMDVNTLPVTNGEIYIDKIGL